MTFSLLSIFRLVTIVFDMYGKAGKAVYITLPILAGKKGEDQ
jgi:hypothetical protein